MAGVQVDMTSWYTVFTNSRPFTLISKSNGGDTTVAMTRASRGEISKQEIEKSNGVYRADDTPWEVYTDLLSGVQPKPGDQGYESDITELLTVIDAFEQCNGTIWRLITRNPRIAYQLADRVDIYEAVFAQDATKSRVPTFQLKYSALAARVQPVSDESLDARGKRLTSRTYNVFLAENIAITTDDQVRFNDVVYEIISWRNAEHLGELMTLEVTLDD